MSSIVGYVPVLCYVALLLLWIYFFIQSWRQNKDFPWGFIVIIMGILALGIRYSFYNNGVVYFSANLSLFIALVGMLLNVVNIRREFGVSNVKELLRFIRIGSVWGLFFGIAVLAITPLTQYGAVNGQRTLFALVSSLVQISLAEEILFRGYLLSYFRKYEFNPIFAVALQSFIFTALHIPQYSDNWFAILIVFLSGYIAGYLSWKNENLISSICLHIVTNLIPFLWEIIFLR